MTQGRFWIAAGIMAVIIIGGFVLSVPHTTEVAHTVAPPPAVPSVSVHDAYKKGVHTLTGSIVAPNACTQVSEAAALTGSTTSPAIVITIAMPVYSGLCLELPTTVAFKLTVSAPAGVPIRATVNGQAASTTP